MPCGFYLDKEDFTLLQSLADNLAQAVVSGNLSQSIGFDVSSVGIIPPPPSSSDESWKEVTCPLSKWPFSTCRYRFIGLLLLCLKEATMEVTREEQTVSYVSSVNNMLLIVEPIAGEFVGPLYQQPSLMAVDEQVGCFFFHYKTFKILFKLLFWLKI